MFFYYILFPCPFFRLSLSVSVNPIGSRLSSLFGSNSHQRGNPKLRKFQFLFIAIQSKNINHSFYSSVSIRYQETSLSPSVSFVGEIRAFFSSSLSVTFSNFPFYFVIVSNTLILSFCFVYVLFDLYIVILVLFLPLL